MLSMMDHPNIIKYVESFEDNRYMYIVTEYVAQSRSLEDVILQAQESKQPGTTLLPVNDVRKLMRMILSGALHIHQNGIIHRDLKPANIIVDEKFELNIIDFGLAVKKQSSNQEHGYFGTPLYMAPEIFESKGSASAYESPVDVYACGMMMYYLFANDFPFGISNAKDKDGLAKLVCNGQLEFNDDVFTHVPRSAKDLMSHMLLYDPKQRFTAQDCL